MAYHNESTEEILRALGADPDTGLTGETAAARLAEHGENRLREKKKKSTLRRFLDQFKDVMILILLAAAAVSFVIACTGDDPMEFFEPVLILLIVVLNAVMGDAAGKQGRKGAGRAQKHVRPACARAARRQGAGHRRFAAGARRHS